MAICWLFVLLAAALSGSGAGCAKKTGREPTQPEQGDPSDDGTKSWGGGARHPKLPSGTDAVREPAGVILVEAAPEYLAGFPTFVAVTLRGMADGPGGGPEFIDDCFGISIEPLGDQRSRLERGALPNGAQDVPCYMSVGVERRMVLNATADAGDLEPGEYRLRFSLRRDNRNQWSEPALFRVVPPSAADLREKARLIGIGWKNKDKSGKLDSLNDIGSIHDPIVLSPKLSERARSQLGILVFLQRSSRMDGRLADVDPKELDAIQEPMVQSALDVYRYELALLRNDPESPALRARVLAKWPGVWRDVEKADRGRGPLFGERFVINRNIEGGPYWRP